MSLLTAAFAMRGVVKIMSGLKRKLLKLKMMVDSPTPASGAAPSRPTIAATNQRLASTSANTHRKTATSELCACMHAGNRTTGAKRACINEAHQWIEEHRKQRRNSQPKYISVVHGVQQAVPAGPSAAEIAVLGRRLCGGPHRQPLNNIPVSVIQLRGNCCGSLQA
jgi:hypothetical protein